MCWPQTRSHQDPYHLSLPHIKTWVRLDPLGTVVLVVPPFSHNAHAMYEQLTPTLVSTCTVSFFGLFGLFGLEMRAWLSSCSLSFSSGQWRYLPLLSCHLFTCACACAF